MNASHQMIVVKGCTYAGIYYLKVDMPKSITCLYQKSTSGYVYVGVHSIMNTTKYVFEKIGLYANNMLSILRFIINMMGEGGKPIWPSNEYENIHFDNEYNIHVLTPKIRRKVTTASI